MSDNGRPVCVDDTIASEKQMLTVLWSIKGPFVIDWLGPGNNVNTTYFGDVIITKLVQVFSPGRRSEATKIFVAFGQCAPSQLCKGN
jgi:hypothetical protein